MRLGRSLTTAALLLLGFGGLGLAGGCGGSQRVTGSVVEEDPEEEAAFADAYEQDAQQQAAPSRRRRRGEY